MTAYHRRRRRGHGRPRQFRRSLIRGPDQVFTLSPSGDMIHDAARDGRWSDENERRDDETEAAEMPKVGEVARVTRRGGDLPNVSDPEELRTSAWLVWQYVRERVPDDAPVMLRRGVPGHHWHGVLSRINGELWPALRDRYLTPAPQAQDVRLRLNRYLSASGNLVCVDRGARPVPGGVAVPRDPVWWVRADWADRPVTAEELRDRPAADAGDDDGDGDGDAGHLDVPASAPASAPAADASYTGLGAAGLTAARAVMDEPGEFPCSGCPRVFVTRRALFSHQRHHQVDQDVIVEAITAALGASTQPLSMPRIRDELDAVGHAVGESELTRLVEKLCADPASPVNVGYVDPKAGTIRRYHLGPPLPPDHVQHPHACREPGCPERFADASTRRDHESRVHPDSPYLTIACGACPERFYSSYSWQVHNVRLHANKATFHELPSPPPPPPPPAATAPTPTPPPAPAPASATATRTPPAATATVVSGVVIPHRTGSAVADVAVEAVTQLARQVAELATEVTRLSGEPRATVLAGELEEARRELKLLRSALTAAERERDDARTQLAKIRKLIGG